MNITIIGTGYVGLVSGACFADIGNSVLCVDKNEKKIEQLKAGKIPFYEPSLPEIVSRNVHEGRLVFSINTHEGLKHAKIVFICVDTPPAPSGEADMRSYNAVLKAIGEFLQQYPCSQFLLVNKSTVPVGTAEYASAQLCSFRAGGVEVVSCPEFLREGTAVSDFLNPERIVIGTAENSDFISGTVEVLLKLFEPFDCPKILVSRATAEIIKYAANAFLATKISFINEIANVCERVGADVNDVAYAIGLDSRIGAQFLRAGIGYGGSCFPKDVRALSQIAGKSGYDFKLLKSVIEVNSGQRSMIIQKKRDILGDLKGKTIAILGLAFKHNTDDIRESPAIEIIITLLEEGAFVRAFDYQAAENAGRVLRHEYFEIVKDVKEVFAGADLVFIATEWPQFAELDWRDLRSQVRQAIIVDGRNILNKKKMTDLGWQYYGVGC